MLLLLLAVAVVYWRVTDCEFIGFDDGQYVVENPHVHAGLSAQSVTWAFTTTAASNWVPLTWLSYMLDYELYGLNPRGYHLTNLLLHLASSALLLLVLWRTTGARGCSAFVAALFALHPLHVESVAWVAERKDVLCGFFFMLTLWAYTRYAERDFTLGRYGLVLLFLGLGLMAKPMLVTVPAVLLLLDFWPLGRFERTRLRTLLLEKVPLLLLAVCAAVPTWLIQASSSATGLVENLGLDLRVGNALLAYVHYIVHFFWPRGLAVFYPHPGADVSIGWAIAAGLLLLGVSVLVLRSTPRRPYLALGWLWYLGMLVPVIGLVQVGEQAMADRYTYLPMIGLTIAVAWGAPDLLERWRPRPELVAAATGLVLVTLASLTWVQIGYWRNSVTLFEHALRVTQDNHLAHTNLGVALTERGEHERAIHHYEQALRIKPDYVAAHFNLAVTLVRQDRRAEAIRHYARALHIPRGEVEGRMRLDRARAQPGKPPLPRTKLRNSMPSSASQPAELEH